MKSLDERRHAYVVRIWEEGRELDGALPNWRGSVDDIQRGTRMYFSTLAELCNYLEQYTGMVGLGSAAAPPQGKRQD